MSYIKTTWVTGDIVTAPRMNNMEGGIYNNDAAITALQSEVTDTQSDVSTLQTNVSTLQTNVTNLQTITGNLAPSIADVFSTSSTYAVGDHVMYNGRLYECKTAVTSAGAWNASAWEAVSVFKYDDVVGVIKITNTSTTMATIETTLAEINTANDHIVFDVSALSAGMHLCTIYLSDGKYRITDLATGFDGEGLYSGTDTLVSILQKGSAPFYNVSTEPYTFRAINAGVGDKESLDKLVGGSLAWNQTIPKTAPTFTNGGVTFTNNNNGSWTITGTTTAGNVAYNLNYQADTHNVVVGHAYFITGCDSTIRIQFVALGSAAAVTASGTTILKFNPTGTTATWARFQIANANTTVNETLYPQVIDLTQMFGSTIADYVYSLESATAGAGVAWLRRYIDIDSYHAYDAGSIQSVQATAHVTTGFNQWNEEWDNSSINSTTGAKRAMANAICTKTPVPVLPNTPYYFKIPSNSRDLNMAVHEYDGNMTNLRRTIVTASGNNPLTLLSNARYIQFYWETSATTGVYDGSVCINISKPAGTPKNGDYVPYNGHTYTLGSDTLRGVPQLVNNKLSFDGDEKTPDGTIRRKYGYVDLGSLTWTLNTSYNAFVATLSDKSSNSICGRYARVIVWSDFLNTDKSYWSAGTTVYVKDSAYSTAAAFQTAMSGVYLVYELATPTTESSLAYQRIQEAPQDGTEAFQTTSIVPVGHYTRWPENVLASIDLISNSEKESPVYSLDSTPYIARMVENMGIIGKESLSKLIGGSLGWNQHVGGATTSTLNGVTFTNNGNGSWTISGTQNATNTFKNISPASLIEKVILENHVYYISGCSSRVYIRLAGNGSSGTIVQTSVTTIKKVTSIYGATGTWIRFQIADDVTTINETLTPQVIDLTAMFGRTIADYVYGLESATAGAGVAWLSKYIDLGTYHAFDAGSIQSVEATAHVTTGKNLLPYPYASTSTTANGVTFTDIGDGTIRVNGTATANTDFLWYAQGGFSLPVGDYIITAENFPLGCYIAFGGMSYPYTNIFGSQLPKTISITSSAPIGYGIMRITSGTACNNLLVKPMIRSASIADATYVPYSGHTYQLGSDTLRGTPQLVNNKLAFDGDIKTPDGTIKRRFGVVTYNGSEDWNIDADRLARYGNGLPGVKPPENNGTVANIICNLYMADTANHTYMHITGVSVQAVQGYLYIYDPRFTTEADIPNWKTWLAAHPMTIVYELATPSTESSTAYKYMQTISADGIESFTTSSPVPVGHETAIPENTLGAIALVAGD